VAGLGGPSGLPPMLLGQAVLRKCAAVESEQLELTVQRARRCTVVRKGILARMLHGEKQGIAHEGWTGHLAAGRPIGEGNDLTRLWAYGRHIEHPVVPEYADKVVRRVINDRVIDGSRGRIGAQVEAVVPLGRHVGDDPEVTLFVEHQIVDRGKPGAIHSTRLAALEEVVPGEGGAGAVGQVFDDLVEAPVGLRRIDGRTVFSKDEEV
jgi:hypothetical protein